MAQRSACGSPTSFGRKTRRCRPGERPRRCEIKRSWALAAMRTAIGSVCDADTDAGPLMGQSTASAAKNRINKPLPERGRRRQDGAGNHACAVLDRGVETGGATGDVGAGAEGAAELSR